MAEAARAREAERRAEARAREVTRAEQEQAHFKYVQAIQELRALEDSLKAERARQQVFYFFISSTCKRYRSCGRSKRALRPSVRGNRCGCGCGCGCGCVVWV